MQSSKPLLDSEVYPEGQYYFRPGAQLGIDALHPPQESFDPTDLLQGELEDCWLVSAVCSLASRDVELFGRIITRMGGTEEHDGDLRRRYLVRLCIDGQWRTLDLDDPLPCRVGDDSLAFAKSNPRHLYLSLIEKAFASQAGYHRLATGFSYEAFATLTGMPVSRLTFEPSSLPPIVIQSAKPQSQQQSPSSSSTSTTTTTTNQSVVDDHWNTLISAFRSGYPMTASCGNGTLSRQPKDYFHAARLRPRHTYSLLNVDEDSKLVQLYNPWGFFQPNSSADNDKAGLFWLEFAQFLRYFDSIDICKYESSLNELRFHNLSPFDVIRITVPQLSDHPGQKLTVTLCQQLGDNSRIDLCFVILDGAQRRIVQSIRGRRFEAFVSLDTELEPGEYDIVPLSFHQLKLADPRHLSLAVHSFLPLTGEVIQEPGTDLLVRDALLSLVMNYGQVRELCSGVTLSILSRGWAGLLIVASNLSTEFVHLRCDSTGSRNVFSSRRSLLVADSIAPGTRQLVFVLTHLRPQEPMSIEHNVSYRLSGGEHLPVEMTTGLLPAQDVYNGNQIGKSPETASETVGDKLQRSISHFPPLDGLVLHTPALIQSPPPLD